MIPYGRQNISADDIESVINVLRSDWLTQGPIVPCFEQSVASYVGAKHAVAANSATSALHIACLALGLGKGDLLWTSPNTFVASANCGLYCKAEVDFVDIDPNTYNMCAKSLAEKLEIAATMNKLPKVVIPVHFAGQSPDMEQIHALSKQYGFKIIEDASHAIGAQYKGKYVGSCDYSDITIFSFHPVKIITSGEGGMAITNDVSLAKSMQSLRSHGITRDVNTMLKQNQPSWYYEQLELGYNYRMTDIHAALGLSQLNRLDSFVLRRRDLACVYNEQLKNLPLILPYQNADTYSSYHLYVIQVCDRSARDKLFSHLKSFGIGVNLHYIPVHLQPIYQKMGFKLNDFIESELYYSRTITLPLYYDLSATQQAKVIDVINDFFNIQTWVL